MRKTLIAAGMVAAFTVGGVGLASANASPGRPAVDPRPVSQVGEPMDCVVYLVTYLGNQGRKQAYFTKVFTREADATTFADSLGRDVHPDLVTCKPGLVKADGSGVVPGVPGQRPRPTVTVTVTAPPSSPTATP